MTIDAAIAALTAMKAVSPLGGDTCLSVCLVASGVADSPVSEIKLDVDGDGALAVIMVAEHEVGS